MPGIERRAAGTANAGRVMPLVLLFPISLLISVKNRVAAAPGQPRRDSGTRRRRRRSVPQRRRCRSGRRSAIAGCSRTGRRRQCSGAVVVARTGHIGQLPTRRPMASPACSSEPSVAASAPRPKSSRIERIPAQSSLHIRPALLREVLGQLRREYAEGPKAEGRLRARLTRDGAAGERYGWPSSRRILRTLSRRRGPDWRAGKVLVVSSRDQVGAAGHGCRHLHCILEIAELRATSLAKTLGGRRRDLDRVPPRSSRKALATSFPRSSGRTGRDRSAGPRER